MVEFIILVLFFGLLGFMITSLRIVPESQEWVVERLGVFHDVWSCGLHLKIPVIDRIAKKISMREQMLDFKPQDVITKDNVNIKVDSIVFYRVLDSRLRTYGVEHPLNAIEGLTATALRNIMGDLELDEALTSRDLINSKITVMIDEATDKWGIKILRVEVRNIIPPPEIQDAMEKQMKSERHRRAQVIQAQAHKESVSTMASGDAEAQVTRASADAKAKLTAAQAEADSIRLINAATAEVLTEMRDRGVLTEYIQIKQFEAFAKAADGKATKIVVPSEIQAMTGLVTSLTESQKDPLDIEDLVEPEIKEPECQNEMCPEVAH